jgi:hypothetical protein
MQPKIDWRSLKWLAVLLLLVCAGTGLAAYISHTHPQTKSAASKKSPDMFSNPMTNPFTSPGSPASPLWGPR